MDSLKAKLSFTASMLESSGLLKLGRFSGEELALSSWRISLYVKITIMGRMDLAADMAKDVKKDIRSKTWACHISSYIFTELFCLALVLKCGD